jgi:hypothetical protein
MRRLFWLGIGVGVGVLVVRKLTRTAEAYTPQGIAASLQSSAAGALDDVRSFVADVRAAMAEREEQIRQALIAELPVEGVSAAGRRTTAFGRPSDHDGYQ